MVGSFRSPLATAIGPYCSLLGKRPWVIETIIMTRKWILFVLVLAASLTSTVAEKVRGKNVRGESKGRGGDAKH
eukprot:scaffold18054_cov92-Amphora_coffeaeformis.AAC.1